MIEKLRDSRGWQLLTITTLVLVVPLMADINGRLGVIRRMHQEEARLSQELAESRKERDALNAELELVKDVAYLEQWARVDARMALPGEVAIIPLLTEQSEPEASVSEDALPKTDAPPSVSEQWHRLFFDETTAP